MYWFLFNLTTFNFASPEKMDGVTSLKDMLIKFSDLLKKMHLCRNYHHRKKV
jgi:hypothetical protein